jgi:hypothetical protein
LFEVGKRYLVYAARVGGELFVSKCSRTQILVSAERDINVLDSLKPKLRVQSSHRAISVGRSPSTAKSNNGMQRTRKSAALLSFTACAPLMPGVSPLA